MNDQLLAEAKRLQNDLIWFISVCNTIHDKDAQMLADLSNIIEELMKGYEDAHAVSN